MANLIREPEVKLKGFPGNSPDISQNVSRTIEKFAHNAGNTIGKSAGNITAKAGEYVQVTRNYTEKHPLQSIAIAAAAGAAVGSLLTMLTRRK